MARERVVCVSAGDIHSLVVVQRGAVFSFGSGGYGKLGHGDEVNRLTPKWVEGLANERVVAVAAGARHSMAGTDRGGVYTWGAGEDGRVRRAVRTSRVVGIQGGS